MLEGAIDGSQNADWPPGTGDWVLAAHCVPDTELNESTVTGAGGPVRPASGDGKSVTTGTSVRPYGSASNVMVSVPIGNRFSVSAPPHCQVDAFARKQSNSTGSGVPVPGSRVHRSVHVCWLTSRSKTSRAAVSVANPPGVPVSPGSEISIGRIIVRFPDWYPRGRLPSSSSDPVADVTGCGAPRSNPGCKRNTAPAHSGLVLTTDPINSIF